MTDHDVFVHRYGLFNEFIKVRVQLGAPPVRSNGNLRMLLKDFKALHNAF